MTKICKVCLVEKSLSDFSPAKACKDGYRNNCKSCHNAAEKARDKSHRITVTYEYKRNERLQRLYGISIEEYDDMLKSQNGVCAICKDANNWNRRDSVLVVDHDHVTGAVRGLLCHYCNSLLGHARDRVDVLSAAMSYLEVKQDEEINSK